MNLTELKNKPISTLVALAEEMGIENMARARKQDIIFSILKTHAKSGEDIFGDGVLEILQDGFGFLRSADSSYLAGPDDIYLHPVKFDVLTFVLAILSQEKYAHLKTVSVILHCLKFVKSITTSLKIHVIKFYSRT